MSMVTILTERGQVSVPAKLRRELNLKAGRKLVWERVSPTECRVRVQLATGIQPDPIKAIGFGRRTFAKLPFASTKDYMDSIREGELG